jgi:hypothetical protein
VLRTDGLCSTGDLIAGGAGLEGVSEFHPSAVAVVLKEILILNPLRRNLIIGINTSKLIELHLFPTVIFVCSHLLFPYSLYNRRKYHEIKRLYTVIIIVIGKTAGFEPKLFLEASTRYVLNYIIRYSLPWISQR